MIFYTSKPEHFKRHHFYYEKVALKLIEEKNQCHAKYCGYFTHPLDDRYGVIPEAFAPVDIVVGTGVKKLTTARIFNH